MKPAATRIPAADLSPLELRQKINVKAAAALNDLSESAFRRYYPHLIRKITPRRDVVELGDAIALPPPEKEFQKPEHRLNLCKSGFRKDTGSTAGN